MLKIASSTVKSPASIDVGRFDLSKSSRTSSGKMTMDLIATKRRVDCTWVMITSAELSAIFTAIDGGKPFFSLQYPDANGESTSMTCYRGDVAAGMWHKKNGVRYWERVTISFIEQ